MLQSARKSCLAVQPCSQVSQRKGAPLSKQKDQLVFPLKGYKPGTYVFSLYYNNQLLESKRLIIQ